MNDVNPAVIKDLLRQSGLRATPARIATLSLMSHSSKPLSHSEVAVELQSLGVDKATVYRNLNDLVSVNLLRRAELGDHVWRFEFVHTGGQECSPHPHFVCIDCGTVSCIHENYVQDARLILDNDIGTVTEVLFRGHCNNC
ncbi:MAG: Fur family transcriptional regulator [Planctomycetaceae bacterium]|nr:Fur family transcriptional regulator [Planctomycetaceae bacterium]